MSEGSVAPLLPFNPVTKRFAKNKSQFDLVGMADLVTGEAQKELDKRRLDVGQAMEELTESMARAREWKKRLTTREEHLKLFMASNDVSKQRESLLEEFQKNTLLAENLIDDVRVIGGEIFITTANLHINRFAPKTQSGHQFTQREEVGRFLIWFRPMSYKGDIEETIKIANLTWRLGSEEEGFFHHPYVARGGLICFGGFREYVEEALKKKDYMMVIDHCIGLLTSHKDHHQGPNWDDYFTLRKPLKEALGDGDPYWYFYDRENGGVGPFSNERFFKSKDKQRAWDKALKTVIKEQFLIRPERKLADTNSWIKSRTVVVSEIVVPDIPPIKNGWHVNRGYEGINEDGHHRPDELARRLEAAQARIDFPAMDPIWIRPDALETAQRTAAARGMDLTIENLEREME